MDRVLCQKLIHDGIEYLEYSPAQYTTLKRPVRKREQGQAPGAQGHHVNFDI